MNAYEEVLFHRCSKEAIDIYTNLNEDGKSKMLEAVRDCILSHNNMTVFNQLENVSLKEESWIYEKEITVLRKVIESSGSIVVSLMNHCPGIEMKSKYL